MTAYRFNHTLEQVRKLTAEKRKRLLDEVRKRRALELQNKKPNQ
jgi:hypothetical protein